MSLHLTGFFGYFIKLVILLVRKKKVCFLLHRIFILNKNRYLCKIDTLYSFVVEIIILC
jgi:hypothetical protein